MSLAAGARLGPYVIEAPLGAGGMGEVYRARDSRLQRDVAIKVLPESFASDPDRLMRFEREAQTLAALNHPHIAQIHGLEESPSPVGPPVRALVMEFVDGEGLDARLARGRVPVDETIAIARQIAQALEAAHERGIIHRDLKPANVKVTTAGDVKVLDFGLAKIFAPTEAEALTGTGGRADSPTITTPAMTRAGIILGTAAYMAPEQARGKSVDRRADIWAFGCVLYEMLTARRAFDGETMTDVLSAVVSKEPDWTALPPSTPPTIHKLLRRCLVKDVRARLQAAGDARIELEEAFTEPFATQLSSPTPVGRASTTNRWIRGLAFAGTGALAATAVTLTLMRAAPAAVDPPVQRFTISLPPNTTGGAGGLALSRDGRSLAIALRDQSGRSRIWMRSLDGNEFQPVAGTEDATTPFWSPDASQLAYFGPGKLMRISRSGGAPIAIADINGLPGVGLGREISADWGMDGAILFSSSAGVYHVAAGGGVPSLVSVVNTAAGELRHVAPRWLPESNRFIYTAVTGGIQGALFVQPIGQGPPTKLLEARSLAYYAPGALLLARVTGQNVATLTANRFDIRSGALDAEGVVLATDIAPEFTASDTGVAVYRPSGFGSDHRFEWVDGSGRTLGEGFETTGANSFNLSRDERFVAFLESGDILLRDFSRGVTTRVSQGPGLIEPILSPDNRRIAYSRTGGQPFGIAMRPAAGGAEEIVFKADEVTLAEDWSSDGRFLATSSRGGRGLIVPVDRDRPAVSFAELPDGSNLDEMRFSPDGRWITYNSLDSGRAEVYLVPIPPTRERWQLSTAGGAQGRWRQDGRAVYYLAPSGEMMMVDLKTVADAPPQIGRPRGLFQTGLVMTQNIDQYAPNANGTRFLLRRPVDGASSSDLQVIVNWPTLLNEASAAGRPR